LSANIERPPCEEATAATAQGGLEVSEDAENILTLSCLPVGARLILRCRKDWRDAAISAVSLEEVTLSVGSPSGHTYRVRRAPDSQLFMDGSLPILGEGPWRMGRVRYDVRW
jgi:hypothetical protein